MSKVLSFYPGHLKITMTDVKIVEVIKTRDYFVLLICLIAGIKLHYYSQCIFKYFLCDALVLFYTCVSAYIHLKKLF